MPGEASKVIRSTFPRRGPVHARDGCVLRDQFRWEPHLSGPAPNYLLAEFLAGGGRLFRILAVSEINNMPKGTREKFSQWLAAPWSLMRGLWWNHWFHAPPARCETVEGVSNLGRDATACGGKRYAPSDASNLGSNRGTCAYRGALCCRIQILCRLWSPLPTDTQ